jgi:glycosyltransferase involved in cell wall biosynthesis
MLSVGLPVYNGERFLADALQSILDQTFEDFALTISDNASDDGTEEICRRYAKEDERIIYHRQAENLGAAANYNFVFHQSEGTYFRWAAHDDLLEPTMLERCVETLTEAQDAVLAYPKTRVSYDDQSDEFYEDNLDLSQETPHERLHHLVTNLDLCNAIFGVIRRDALRQTRLIDSFASSDEVLLAELALLGPFQEVPEYLFIRRLHPDRSTVAAADAKARTAWFDPNSQHKRHLHRTKVLKEDLRSAWRAPLTTVERTRSTVSLLRGYLPRWWQLMAREAKEAVFQ